jgi:plastocyanin
MLLAAFALILGSNRSAPGVGAQGSGSGSVIRGGVEIGLPITTRRASPAYPSRAVSPDELAPVSELRHVVVYLKGATPQASLPATKAEMRQQGEAFVPRVLAVSRGSVVEFPNGDPIYHNVFSLSRAATFDLGRFPRGETRTVKFDKPGLVKVFCQIHSHMNATVIVFDHPWFAIPDDEGKFELKGVPTGQRELVAWHERLGDTTISVSVEAGRVTAADFVLPVPRTK